MGGVGQPSKVAWVKVFDNWSYTCPVCGYEGNKTPTSRKKARRNCIDHMKTMHGGADAEPILRKVR